MKPVEKREQCCGCGACAQICPVKCIAMEADREGFPYPEITGEVCISCGLCEKVCPVAGKTAYSGYMGCYTGYAKEDEIRDCSSSGGIFSLLATAILGFGGVLYGAAADEEQTVRHIRVDSVSGLCLLRGSKYLQSKTENTFSEAKRDLEAGRYVLYSGTACQIAGLKQFLMKDYDKLYTVDVLCHGVPSPAVWKKYLEWQMRKHGAGSVRQMSFRNKKYGWKRYALQLLFDNGREYLEEHGEDIFLQMFLADICLRPSCHACRFKDLSRMSDLTIGDAWGVDSIDSEMDDDRGTSVILVHSFKGEKILKEVAAGARMHRADVEHLLPPWVDSRKSVAVHPGRKCFFMALHLFGTGIFTLWKLLNIGRRMKKKVKKLLAHRKRPEQFRFSIYRNGQWEERDR